MKPINQATICCPRCKGAGVVTVRPLETLRRRRGLDQGGLAKVLGVQQSQISRIESGETPIPWKHRDTLAELFGVTKAQLMGNDPLPAAGAVVQSRAHRDKVKAAQKAKAKGRRP